MLPFDVEQLPLGVLEDPVPDQVGERLPQVLPDHPAEGLRGQVQEGRVVGRGVEGPVVGLNPLPTDCLTRPTDRINRRFEGYHSK